MVGKESPHNVLVAVFVITFEDELNVMMRFSHYPVKFTLTSRIYVFLALSIPFDMKFAHLNIKGKNRC